MSNHGFSPTIYWFLISFQEKYFSSRKNKIKKSDYSFLMISRNLTCVRKFVHYWKFCRFQILLVRLSLAIGQWARLVNLKWESELARMHDLLMENEKVTFLFKYRWIYKSLVTFQSKFTLLQCFFKTLYLLLFNKCNRKESFHWSHDVKSSKYVCCKPVNCCRLRALANVTVWRKK